jgi:hypothetical protein
MLITSYAIIFFKFIEKIKICDIFLTGTVPKFQLEKTRSIYPVILKNYKTCEKPTEF